MDQSENNATQNYQTDEFRRATLDAVAFSSSSSSNGSTTRLGCSQDSSTGHGGSVEFSSGRSTTGYSDGSSTRLESQLTVSLDESNSSSARRST